NPQSSPPFEPRSRVGRSLHSSPRLLDEAPAPAGEGPIFLVCWQGCTMARDGLYALLCAGALTLTGPVVPALSAPGDDRDTVVAAALVVQTAMQQGRDFNQRGDFKSAVRVLEEHLAKINGNPTYLALLRDAYRGHIRDLKLAKQDAEAERYLQRL